MTEITHPASASGARFSSFGRVLSGEVVLGEGMLKGLEAIYMQPDGELRAMVLVELLSKPHLISYEVASLLPQT